MVGIYKITNLINGKSYIGQSTKIKTRLREHFTGAFLFSYEEYNTPLHQAIRKYGKNNFSYEILEECLKEKLNEREIYWIEYYHTYINTGLGYNLTKGGQERFSKINSNNYINSIINYLKNTKISQKEIALKFNLSEEMIQGINTGRYWYQDNIDYPIRKPSYRWKKEKDYKVLCPICKSNLMWSYSNQCIHCLGKNNSILPPQKEELENKLKEYKTYTKTASYYKISTVLLNKWMDELNIFRPRKRK